MPNATVLGVRPAARSPRPRVRTPRRSARSPLACTATSRGSSPVTQPSSRSSRSALWMPMMPTPPPVGIDDHVGQPPAELLDDLVAHGLLALEPVRLPQRRDVLVARARRRPRPRSARPRPRSGRRPGRAPHRPPRTRPRVIAGASAGIAIRLRMPGPGRVGRPGRAGVAVGRHRDARDAQLGGPGHADRRAAGLERAGRDRAPRPSSSSLGTPIAGAEPGQGQQRGHALAEGDDARGIRGPAAARGSATGPVAGPRWPAA